MPIDVFDPLLISFVYSGGSSNSNPAASLGGLPSSVSLPARTNNLFDNLFPNQAIQNNDYRCFYIRNNNSVATLRNTEIWIDSEIDDGADIQLGVISGTEHQRIIIEAGTVTGGDLTLSLDGSDVTFSYNSDIAVWASNLQSEILSECSLDVTVTGSTFAAESTTLFIFDILFDGEEESYRYYDLIEFVSSSLTGSDILDPTFQKVEMGGPINVISPDTGNVHTAPVGVVFTTPTIGSTIEIGTVNAGEWFPVWVKRTVPVGAKKASPDGFIFKMQGNGFSNS